MATFRVGQRVRMRATEYFGPYKNPSGLEGTISGIGCFEGLHSGRLYAYSVDLDCGRALLADAHELEPIKPARNQVIAWSECLWQPNKEIA